MANEVVICEWKQPEGGLSASIIGKLITSQVLDAGDLSAELNDDTKLISITANGAAIWVKQGGSGVSAAANTDGNIFIPSNATFVLPVDSTTRYVDTAADV
jgi:hypothetical protein